MFIPGTLLLYALGTDRYRAFALSSLASTAFIALLGIMYNKVGIYANWVSILVVPTLVLAAVSLSRSKFFPAHQHR